MAPKKSKGGFYAGEYSQVALTESKLISQLS